MKFYIIFDFFFFFIFLCFVELSLVKFNPVKLTLLPFVHTKRPLFLRREKSEPQQRINNDKLSNSGGKKGGKVLYTNLK